MVADGKLPVAAIDAVIVVLPLFKTVAVVPEIEITDGLLLVKVMAAPDPDVAFRGKLFIVE